jgi:hypothetical protein
MGDQDVRDIRPCRTGLTERHVHGSAGRIHACIDQDDTGSVRHQVRTHVKRDRFGSQRARGNVMHHRDGANPGGHVINVPSAHAGVADDQSGLEGRQRQADVSRYGAGGRV